MRTKVRKVQEQLQYLLKGFHLLWEASPRLNSAWFALLVVQGALPVGTIYLSRLFVDALVPAIQAGGAWESLRPVILYGALIGALFLAGELLQGATEWVRAALAEFVQDHVSNLIHAKSVALDLAYYETPDFYDHLHRATADASYRPISLLESAGSLIQNGLTLLGMGALLLAYGAWLPFVLFFSMLPALYVVFTNNRKYHRWWHESTQDRRWANYFDYLLTANEAAAELRLFDLGDHFRASFQAIRRRLRGERLDLLKTQSLARAGAALVSLLLTGSVMVWFGWRVLRGLLTLGDLALFYQVFNRGQTLMRALLGDLGQIYASNLFLGGFFEFLALAPGLRDPARPQRSPARLKRGISFRQVGFRYPGSPRAALQDFNLEIPAGQVAAIVGENGAGKTTLVKLLCRLYDVEAGAIELDGVDLRQIPIADLRGLTTVLFQDPVPYYASAGQNIALGNVSAGPGRPDVEAAARRAGAHEVIRRLPEGYDTLLGRYFAGGAELSAGEWQRVALARAYVRQAELVILDEPTSFMDSWSEADWFDRLRQLVDGRTAVVITHRLTVARRADIIHVMHAGRIVESGAHEALLRLGGRYAESWFAQMQGGDHPLSPDPFPPSMGKGGMGERVVRSP